MYSRALHTDRPRQRVQCTVKIVWFRSYVDNDCIGQRHGELPAKKAGKKWTESGLPAFFRWLSPGQFAPFPTI